MKRLASILLLSCVPYLAIAQTPAPAPLRPSPPEIAQPGDAVLMKSCDGVLSIEKTYALARHWIDAWNSQSRSRIMAMYTPDFEFRARGILNNPNISHPSGVL